MAKRKFTIVLIKPSHYDDNGYVIQWRSSTIPSNRDIEFQSTTSAKGVEYGWGFRACAVLCRGGLCVWL